MMKNPFNASTVSTNNNSLDKFASGTGQTRLGGPLRDTHALIRFVLLLVILIVSFSVIFHVFMAYEDQDHSWVTGFYWTLSTMSTLGYGDVSFHSDAGRLFSMVVLLSGVIFLLVLLPFTFLEMVYLPWLEKRKAGLVPRELPEKTKGHVVLTFYGPIASALINKLIQFNYPYVVVLDNFEETATLRARGINAIFGELYDPQTYQNIRVEQAALVATTRTDVMNTSIVFTVRGITTKVPVISTIREEASHDILKLAGCSRVLDITRLMAESLARRAVGAKKLTHAVGEIDDLLIVEVNANRTTLVGKSYQDAQQETRINIIGFWARGQFELGEPESMIEENTVLLMAGTKKQCKDFDTKYRAESRSSTTQPVIIIGGGRVGRSTQVALKRRGIESRIVEQDPARVHNQTHYIHGCGTSRTVLESAGIERASTVIITPHDDEMNTYLTLLCRLLRPDIQIICRSTLERNVSVLHRAGADIVLSYASMGANALFNLLQRSSLLLIAEGLDVFKVPVPKSLANKTLVEANFRQSTQCSVIGISGRDATMTHPGPNSVLPEGGEMILIGTPDSEKAFFSLYPGSD